MKQAPATGAISTIYLLLSHVGPASARPSAPKLLRMGVAPALLGTVARSQGPGVARAAATARGDSGGMPRGKAAGESGQTPGA